MSRIRIIKITFSLVIRGKNDRIVTLTKCTSCATARLLFASGFVPAVLGESSQRETSDNIKNFNRRCNHEHIRNHQTGGKQVKVEVGQAVYVEKLNVEAGQEVTFNEVVLVGGDKTVVGTPVVEGATVVGTIEKQGKQKKVVTFKYKPKKGSHRKQGHRQPYTKVVINAINA